MARKKPLPAASEKEQSRRPVVYIGPTFKDSVLNTFMVFVDGVPEQYREDPIYKNLFVVPSKLDESRREVGRKGSLLHTMYHRALAEHNKKE